MDNYTRLLSQGMVSRGHSIEVWQPAEILTRLPFGPFIKKWLGYIDAYFIFPVVVKSRLRKCDKNTLFVFIDQALGPWVPLVSDKAHIIHCHDFLALKSANGDFEENKTGWSGRLYQRYIFNGYRNGKSFISVSKETKKQLKELIQLPDYCSKVVYNPLNNIVETINFDNARTLINLQTQIFTKRGYIVHVGGNQWYKNRRGVIQVYEAWRTLSKYSIPLLLIGEAPNKELTHLAESSHFAKDIHFISNKSDDFIQNAYAGASVLLYPSLAEGFGWPIAEALAAGCMVITTGLAPMTEVGGEAAFYIDRMPADHDARFRWAVASACIMEQVIDLPEKEKSSVREAGIKHVSIFNAADSLNQIEKIYSTLLPIEV
jgi:glycosyltransferase involved in cell wall biosynthesis